MGRTMSDRERCPTLYELRIDELVLDGFSPGERYAIAAALERELTRLLSLAAPPFATAGARSLSVDSVDAGTLTLDAGVSPAALGVAAARAVNRRLVNLNAGSAPERKGGSRVAVSGSAPRSAEGPRR
jgi:hypothetical protein